ncbi:hypothetical protein Plhal703r1_c71g0171281 [Plasmopara halstedii]
MNNKEEQQPAHNVVSTAVLLVSAVFLSGGFYHGMTKQTKALEKEEKKNMSVLKRESIKSIDALALDHKFKLKKPQAPSIAAWKALLGVTLVSVTGCGVLIGGAAIAIGVTDMTEFQKRFQRFPRKDKQMQLVVDKVDESGRIKSTLSSITCIRRK